MKIIVEKDKIKIEKTENINSSSLNYYVADIEFDESWERLTKKAILLKNGETKGEEIAIINNQIFMNIDLNGKYYIGLVGFSAENNTKVYQISTNLVPFLISKGTGEILQVDKQLPSMTEWEIYIKQIQEMCDGVIIKDIIETIDGLNHNITIEYTNGSSFTFTIKDGEKGADGENGKDALINGVNILEIEGGKNISIRQTESTLVINNDYEYDDSNLQANIETLTEALEETDRELTSRMTTNMSNIDSAGIEFINQLINDKLGIINTQLAELTDVEVN